MAPFSLSYSGLTMPRTAAFHEGYGAFEIGQTPKQNPYPQHTRQSEEWLNGWRLAHDEFIWDDIEGQENDAQFFEIRSGLFRQILS